MKSSAKFLAIIFAVCLTMTAFSSSAHAFLFGCDWSGNLYSVNETNAALTLIGNTGLSLPGALEYGPDGNLYCFTASTVGTSALYRLDQNTAAATLIGSLGFPAVIEGGLAFSSSGTAYGVHINSASSGLSQLFTLDLNTGAATVVADIGSSYHDINGLAWRSDGMLVGLADDNPGALVTIDPITGAIATIINPTFSVGAVGGMTTDFSTGISYFGTGSGTGNDGNAGTSSLYSFDLYTGGSSLIGSFSGLIDQGQGLSGLAASTSAVPEPGTLMLLGSGLLGLGIFRRRK